MKRLRLVFCILRFKNYRALTLLYLQIQLIHGRVRHPQTQGKIERFNQTLGRHLTKMLWDEVSQTQGYRWIDVLPAFVIAYNKAPHETHKKSPYEAFFGFKMRGVYGTPSEILIESNQVEGSCIQDTYDDTTDHTKNYEINYDTDSQSHFCIKVELEVTTKFYY